ncbi:ATP-binding protein, partial [Escherichia coli]|nr:ATP-binding protein [Escherichia coli]
MAEPAQRPSTLRERLLSARRRRFVGRESEKALLGELLRPESPFLLLHVYGPGGVGKTTLLGEFAALALEHGF